MLHQPKPPSSKASRPVLLAAVSLAVFALAFGALVLHRRGLLTLPTNKTQGEAQTTTLEPGRHAPSTAPGFKDTTFTSAAELFRHDKRSFSPDPEAFSAHTRRFVDIPNSLSEKRAPSFGPSDDDVYEGPGVEYLRGYRTGLIEINETKEFSNKITLSSIDWKLTPVADKPGHLAAKGTTTISGHPALQVSLVVNSRGGGFLSEILVAQQESAKSRGLIYAALELRSTDQKRGTPITRGLVADQASAIGYQAERIDDQGATDVAVLFRNSQWLDIPMRKGQQKYLISVELPDFTARIAR